MASNLSFNLNGPGRPLSTNPTVPGILNKFQGTPISTALNTATQPDWKTQLNTVMSGYKAPTNQPVTTTGPRMTPLPQTPKATGLVSKEIKTNVDGSKSEVHYDNKTQDTNPKQTGTTPQGTPIMTGSFPPGTPQNAGPGPTGELRPATLPNGQSAFTNAAGDFVDAQGNPIPAAGTTINQQPPSAGVTFPGLIGSAQGMYGQLPGLGQQAANITAQAQRQYEDIGRQAARAGAGYSTTGTTPVAEGNAAVLARTAAAQQQAVTGGAQLGLTGLAQQQAALTGAGAGMAGLAGLAPEALRYGATGAGGFDLQTAIQNLAKDVANGVKSPSQAEQMLGNNMMFNTQLDQAIKALSPSYDRVQAEALAQAKTASAVQTGTIGGTLTKSADSANQALDKLELDFNKLSSLQTGGIPLTNSISNWIGQAFGQQALASYQTTLADARAQLQGVLTASGGATPTGAEQMAYTYLPDDMTPGMLKEKIAAARALVKQKVEAFTSTTPTSGGGGAGTVSSGGYNFKQDANGNWVPA